MPGATEFLAAVWIQARSLSCVAAFGDDAKPVVIHIINDEIVNHAAFAVEHAGVERAASGFELVDVIGEQQLQKIARGPALEVGHHHVRNVEHAGIAAHLMVLLNLRTVVQRHIPAAEID